MSTATHDSQLPFQKEVGKVPFQTGPSPNGQRGRAGIGALSVLNVAAMLATKALTGEDGGTVHERIVLALEPLQGWREVLTCGDGVYRERGRGRYGR